MFIGCFLLPGRLYADYNTCTENYQLKEVHENQYYVANTDENSVSVYIMDDEYWEKKTFPENKVKFRSTTGEAKVQIKLKKLQKPSTAEKFWFLKGVGIKQKKEVYKSVIISVPEGSAVTESSNKETKTPVITQNGYCSKCGVKTSASNEFCDCCKIKLN